GGYCCYCFCSSRRRHTRFSRDWSSDVCSSDLVDDIDYSGHGAYRDGDVIGAVGEGHGTGGEDHENSEYTFNTGKPVFGIGRLVLADPTEKEHPDDGDQDSNRNGDQAAFKKAETDAGFLEDVGQPFQDGYHRDQEAHGEHIKGDIAFGVAERVVGIEDQVLHRTEDPEGDNTCDDGGDNPAGDDGGHCTPVNGIDGNTH